MKILGGDSGQTWLFSSHAEAALGKSIYFLLRWKSKKRSKLKNLLRSKKQKQFIFCFDMKAKSKVNKICFLLFHKKQKQDVFIWVAFLRNFRLVFLVIFIYRCYFFGFLYFRNLLKNALFSQKSIFFCFAMKAKSKASEICFASKQKAKFYAFLLCFLLFAFASPNADSVLEYNINIITSLFLRFVGTSTGGRVGWSIFV